MVSGRGPSLASIHRPPKPLEILIYGNSSSPAIAAVSKEDFSSTLTMVGHKISTCENPTECEAAVAKGHFDVVLADPRDAANLKASNAQGVVPIALNPTKDEMGKLKSEYSVAFDASRDAVRLLPLLVKAAKRTHR